MPTNRLSKALQYLRKTTLSPDGADLSDGQLLDHFLDRRDEAAFAALMRRHGPMVWGVCYREAGHHHDAEDAFQATFLVLARKAAVIRQRELLANWLYGVAFRTARKAKAVTGRRRARERQLPDLPEAVARQPDPWRELEPLLDRELAGLPDKYRVAILLCDLGGKTGKEAARQLRIPEGTLFSRLRTARVLLAKRLGRHRAMLSGGALAAVLSREAAAAPAPAAVVALTIRAAPRFAAGQAAASGAVSTKVATLMKGVLNAMTLTKLKVVLTVLLVLGLIAFGGRLFYQTAAVGQTASAEQGSRSPQAPVAKTAPAKQPGPGVPVPPARAAVPTPKEKGHAVVTYPVADLVIPIHGLDIPLPATEAEKNKTKENWLIHKITRTVAPASWHEGGGTGTIQYFPHGHALVVDNTARVQAQVNDLLETLRRLQTVEVSAEIHILSLSAAGFLKVQALVPRLTRDGDVVLTELEAFALLRKAREDADTKALLAPRVTVFPGQRVNIMVDPAKGVPGIDKMDVALVAFVAGNLNHMALEVKAEVGKMTFARSVQMQDGETLAQVKRQGDRYMVLVVTPRVILNLEEAGAGSDAVAPK